MTPPVSVVHHLEEVMGTIVTIDVYATPGSPADGGAGRPGAEVSQQLAEAVAILHQASSPRWWS